MNGLPLERIVHIPNVSWLRFGGKELLMCQPVEFWIFRRTVHTYIQLYKILYQEYMESESLDLGLHVGWQTDPLKFVKIPT